MFHFTDDCLIGIKEIDEEHKRLFQLINEATEFMNDGDYSRTLVINLIRGLKDYAGTHFAHEEAYMEKINDMELEGQKAEHAWFAEKINTYRVDELTEDNYKEVLGEILSFTAKWLYHHIIGSDTMIGKARAKAREEALSFSDKYKTGIKLIDDEHRRLFEIIKETDDLIRNQTLYDKYDAIMEILTELAGYSMRHFTDEEHYMEKINYKGLEMQRVAHRAFIENLENINTDELDNNQTEYLSGLIDFLLGWLTNHILKMDKQIPVQ